MNKKDLSERDICSKFIGPAVKRAGWDGMMQIHDRKEADKNYVGVFLLALAFANAPPTPLELIGDSFKLVHEAARRESLSDSAWIIIEPLVPELSWLSNWDKCERLRRGLISAFVRNNWPVWELERRIKDHDLVQQLLRSARKAEGGDDFLRRVNSSH